MTDGSRRFLYDAIRLALENIRRIGVSAYGPRIANANVLAEYGRFDPAITFNRSYGETVTSGAIMPPVMRPPFKTDDYSPRPGRSAPRPGQ